MRAQFFMHLKINEFLSNLHSHQRECRLKRHSRGRNDGRICDRATSKVHPCFHIKTLSIPIDAFSVNSKECTHLPELPESGKIRKFRNPLPNQGKIVLIGKKTWNFIIIPGKKSENFLIEFVCYIYKFKKNRAWLKNIVHFQRTDMNGTAIMTQIPLFEQINVWMKLLKWGRNIRKSDNNLLNFYQKQIE